VTSGALTGMLPEAPTGALPAGSVGWDKEASTSEGGAKEWGVVTARKVNGWLGWSCPATGSSCIDEAEHERARERDGDNPCQHTPLR
jgi:hypothetical protein